MNLNDVIKQAKPKKERMVLSTMAPKELGDRLDALIIKANAQGGNINRSFLIKLAIERLVDELEAED